MKKVNVIMLIMALCSIAAQAQTKTENDTSIYNITEVMPEYPGGDTEMMKYMMSIKYPDIARLAKQDGTVFIRFIVEKDGSISNVSPIKSSGHAELDKTAVEHISQMPQWKPGYQNGQPVRVQYVLPVKFKL